MTVESSKASRRAEHSCATSIPDSKVDEVTSLRRSPLDNCIRNGYILRGHMVALTPAVFHVLLSLARVERHGYGIQKDVREQTGGEVHLGPGTLYGTLQRLMVLDWVEETEGPATPEDERRRYYRLTRAGRRALKGEVERMDTLVRTARAHQVVPRAANR